MQRSLHHFHIVLLTLKQHIIDDFLFNQNINNNKKSVNLHMKFN